MKGEMEMVGEGIRGFNIRRIIIRGGFYQQL